MKFSMPPWPMSRGNGSGPDSALDRLEALDAELAESRRAELERIGSLTAEEAALISHEIAGAVEREARYPGRIKITVIRESRATSYAR